VRPGRPTPRRRSPAATGVHPPACAAWPNSCRDSRASAQELSGSQPRRCPGQPRARPAPDTAPEWGSCWSHGVQVRSTPQCRIIRKGRLGGGEPPCAPGESVKERDLRPPPLTQSGQCRGENRSLAQAHQDLSILEHLESPLAHAPLPGNKSRKGSCGLPVLDGRRPPEMAPICRSRRGSITPILAGSYTSITRWLQYVGR
jgi:hypothetical protein